MKYTIIFILVFFPSLNTAKEKNDTAQKLTQLLISKGAIQEIDHAKINDFEFVSFIVNKLDGDFKPSKTTSIQNFISHPDTPKVVLELNKNKEKTNGVSIFQKETGTPYLTVSDLNGDGIFDFLTYAILDKNGRLLLSVEDYGMDGQIDFKYNFITKKASVFYKDKWRDAVGPIPKQYVLVDKKKVQIKDILLELKKQK